MNVLIVNSSMFLAAGKSHELSTHARSSLLAAHPDAKIVERNLLTQTEHLSLLKFTANTTSPSDRTAEQVALAALSDSLIAELQAADVLVLGVPMYNFGMPSTLKSWFDRVIRNTVTFEYTESGPRGLLSAKKVLVCAARGGSYVGSELDTQTPYLKTLLGFMGLSDVEFVYAEGLAQGVSTPEQILATAKTQIDGWVNA